MKLNFHVPTIALFAMAAAFGGAATPVQADNSTTLSAPTSDGPTVPVPELVQRREAVLARFRDGIVLLHSSSGFKRWEDAGFRQDANFYYLTGMPNLQDAILALDGPRKESTLFIGAAAPFLTVAEPLFAGLNQFTLPIGGSSASSIGVTSIENWNAFPAWLDGRLRGDPKLPLYGDNAGQVGDFEGAGSDPPGLLPVANAHLLWYRAILERWPNATVKPAHPGLDAIRAVKSDYEQMLLRRVALMTLPGINAAIGGIRPGRTHRQVEGSVIAAMMDAGAEGPGFWPWARSGTSAYLPGLFASFLDYHALDHVMVEGEIARVNLGAEYQMYKGDYGRTFPVGMRFTLDQREVLGLFSDAYLAGLQRFRPGAAPADAVNASIAYVKDHQGGVKSDLARAAVAQLVTPAPWSMYGHGIDMVEGVPGTFAAGNVICWAPEFSVQGQGFYVQDMVLVTPGGHELLNPQLPYGPLALEAMKARLTAGT